ncbi:hypothetical protein BU26DRAFT_202967 [Trematosphaeria pertusa]|uniref:F-box domain-containing protein n=1 Tax=Trematosphaeria pertusa TaxID=390896 RepID=A0A6A6HRF4_9PLEO|nr:uncharacterized protein BU26DRAFT_202967 [Trematosphaeria pertusa]KAF2240591.1 hypothetical protein BU26DRAFT_202967 [Trematosphaeria pertusa]
MAEPSVAPRSCTPPNTETTLAVRSTPKPEPAADASASSALNTIFRFMDLPAELRLHIYETLLVDTHSYIVPIANLPPARPHVSKSLQPVILRLSRQIHKEALPVLYSSNTFLIRTYPLKRCVPELTLYFGQENAGLIRRVFTVADNDWKEELVEVQKRYKAMGISWEQLQLWGVRIRPANPEDAQEAEDAEGEARRWTEGSEGLVEADEREMERLGVKAAWWEFSESAGGRWVVKKGSLARGGGVGG